MRLLPSPMVALAGWLFCTLASGQIVLQNTTPANTSSTQIRNNHAPVRLPPGTEDILKLAKAEVGEDAILAFIVNSGKTYPLNADQIIYLKQSGISAPVLTAMLNQKAAQAPTAPAFKPSNGTKPAPPPQQQQVAQMPGQETAYASASSLYVIPYPITYSSYYAYPSYYSTPYYYPGLSFSFGYNFGYPKYRYPHYAHYPSSNYRHPYYAQYGGYRSYAYRHGYGYKHNYGHYATPYYRGGHYGAGYRQPFYGSGHYRHAGVPASSRFVGGTGQGGWPQTGFHSRGTYIGGTGMGGHSSAFHSRGTYVGATGMGGSRPASTFMAANGRGFSGGAPMARMGGGGGFRGGGGRR
ncbi:MAG TPA: hypothetical protein VN673_01945 [Clostridia bacterium]|nr:hypothetical protein [Clostridia bacterium]